MFLKGNGEILQNTNVNNLHCMIIITSEIAYCRNHIGFGIKGKRDHMFYFLFKSNYDNFLIFQFLDPLKYP